MTALPRVDTSETRLGTINGPIGRFDRSDVFYSFTSPLYPNTVFRFDAATGQTQSTN